MFQAMTWLIDMGRFGSWSASGGLPFSCSTTRV
jgi:hypothetical protein